jgi:hypothetical protein
VLTGDDAVVVGGPGIEILETHARQWAVAGADRAPAGSDRFCTRLVPESGTPRVEDRAAGAG